MLLCRLISRWKDRLKDIFMVKSVTFSNLLLNKKVIEFIEIETKLMERLFLYQLLMKEF